MIKREYQIKILSVLNEGAYKVVYGPEITELFTVDVLCANLQYLHDCGYVEALIRKSADGYWSFGGASITSKGVSFFEENGGLYKKATTSFIEIDQESFRQMLQAYIEASGKDKTVKARLVSAVKNAPAEALKTLAGSLLRVGLQEASDAWQLLESTLSH